MKHTMIDCPNCGGKTAVIESRRVKGTRRRRRVCKSCGEHFTTYEVDASNLTRLHHVAAYSALVAAELRSLSAGVLNNLNDGEAITIAIECMHLAKILMNTYGMDIMNVNEL